MRCAVFSLVLAGCAADSGPPPPPPWTSGTAVLATQYRGSDNFETLAGGSDPALSSSCAFDAASRALVGCVPPFATSRHHLYKWVGYTALETDDGFSIITSVDMPEGAPVPDGSGRLQNLFEHAGAVRRFAGIHDTMFDRDCRPYVDSGVTYCLPAADQVTLGDMWTDATCTGATVKIASTPAVYVSGGPFTVLLCDTQATVYEMRPQSGCVQLLAYTCHSIVDQLALLTLE